MKDVLVNSLSRYLDLDLDLVINQNRTTMLSILERKGKRVRLSIHEIFLKAPEPVLLAVASFVSGRRNKSREHHLVLRTFIQQQLAQSDFTHLLKKQELIQQGEIYHLKRLYDQNNKTYFDNKLDLAITWYGNRKSRPQTRITFGQYVDGLRLIKIHRMLDDPFFPEYFVSFIVYHEMLHAVIPGSPGRGRFCFHGEAFKNREKEFKYFRRAIEWEKKNKKDLFRKSRI